MYSASREAHARLYCSMVPQAAERLFVSAPVARQSREFLVVSFTTLLSLPRGTGCVASLSGGSGRSVRCRLSLHRPGKKSAKLACASAARCASTNHSTTHASSAQPSPPTKFSPKKRRYAVGRTCDGTFRSIVIELGPGVRAAQPQCPSSDSDA